jgi:hypothetical protein
MKLMIIGNPSIEVLREILILKFLSDALQLTRTFDYLDITKHANGNTPLFSRLF